MQLHGLRVLPARIWGLIALAGALALPPESAPAQFVVNDRLVTDPNVNIPNPSFDQITNTMVWQDKSKQLWVAKINPVTGDISPSNGMGKLLDDKAANQDDVGNSAMFASGDGFSSVVYSRDLAGVLTLGEAAQTSNSAWSRVDVVNPLNRWKSEGTHANQVGSAKVTYILTENGREFVGARDLGNPGSERVIGGLIPGQGGRWIEGENSIMSAVFVNDVWQVATIDLNLPDPKPVQVTFEAESVFNSYSWIAPEFNGPVFSGMIGGDKLGIFRKKPDGTWENFYTFKIPSQFKELSSPEGFVWNGKSYIFVVAASATGVGPFPFQPVGPSQIWIAGIDPANPFFRRIDDQSSLKTKSEPEVFFTANGPQIFYGERQPNGNIAQRIADTGLGPDYAYDNPNYSGPWASQFRDNKNCSCTPFPVGDGYQEITGIPFFRNQQWVRPVMGPEGNLYASMAFVQGGLKSALGAYNPATALEVFRANINKVDTSLLGSSALVATNGDVIQSSNTQLTRHTSGGVPVWTVPVRGMAESIQFAPDGNLLAFTFNGWIQVFSPVNGQVLSERILTPWRTFPPTPTCLSGGALTNCAYITAPAVDMRASRVYVSYTTPSATTTIQAFSYDRTTRALTMVWESAVLATGASSAPVLSNDLSRLYVQSKDGKLYALNAASGAIIWSFNLGASASGTPVVNEFGYIMPGTRQSDSTTVNFVGIIKDTGASAQWAFRTTDFSAQSLAAAGRGNRFVLMARRNSDGALVLLVVNPKFGVVTQTQVTVGPMPVRTTGVVIDLDGSIYVGTSGTSPYRAFRPTYATSIQ